MADELRPIIKKIKKVEGGGHGSSAWKVAYADFVTAMMAFFMLLWLLNVTTDEQKHGIADYFAPTVASMSQSGSGDILAGTALAEEGARSAGAPTVVLELETPEGALSSTETDEETESKSSAAQLEEESFEDAAERLRQSLEELPEMAELSDNLLIDMTPDGLRIQLIDLEGRGMFRTGTAEMFDHMRTLLKQVAVVTVELPNKITVTGHTDSTAFQRGDSYDNWELSADRANVSRRELIRAGIGANRMSAVSGKADSELMFPEDPFLPANRRISVLLRRESTVLPPKYVK